MQLKREEDYWRQKAGYEWFKDGERNTKFFHTIVKGRRSRLRISKIQNEDGQRLEEVPDIAEATVNFFQKQFTKQNDADDFSMPEKIPELVNDEQNVEIMRIPNEDEVKNVVMGLNRDSAGGPDGMTTAFYKDAQEIIKQDIHKMVKSFFCGFQLPRFITHTNLVLLPKKLVVNNFSDMRPISLSNFFNKIFSRIVHERIKGILPHLIPGTGRFC